MLAKPATLLTALCVPLAVLALAAAPQGFAASHAKRARIDPGFGSGGWAHIPVPRCCWMSGGLTSAIADAHENYFVTVGLKTKSKRKPSGGVIVKFNSSGELVHAFGRRGVVRIHGQIQPWNIVILSDGSLLVTSGRPTRKGGVKRWYVTRLHSDGRRDRTFGKAGSIHFNVTDPERFEMPSVYPLAGGRFALVLRDDQKVSWGNRVRVFKRSGDLDRRFATRGVEVLPYEVSDIAPMRGEDMLLTGSDRDGVSVTIERRSANGAPVARWGSGGRTVLNRISARDWTLGDAKAFGQNSDLYGFGVSGGKVAPLSRGVSVTFNTFLGSEWSETTYGWAIRLGPHGRVDRTWGIKGRRNAARGNVDLGDDTDDHESIEAVPLADGRIFGGVFFSGMWDTHHEAAINVIGRSGKKAAAGSRRVAVNNFAFYSEALSPDGKFYFAIGNRKKRLVAFRVRL